MDIKKTTTQVNNEVREVGKTFVNLDELTEIANNAWIGETEVDGCTRYFEIKITVKKLGYSWDDVQVILDERDAVKQRNAERAEAATAKKAKDEARRAEAKAKKEAEAASE